MKGPKGMLSAAIADAMAEFFVVDAGAVESNLLSDTKIVLHHVDLKPQSSTLEHKNTWGTTTTVHVTGTVDEVAFTWSWNTRSTAASGTSSWIKDAVLTIVGAKFHVQLRDHHEEHGQEVPLPSPSPSTTAAASAAPETTATTTQSLKEREQNRNDIQKQGGVHAYLSNQVQLVMDALTLVLVDFELTIEMPPPKVVDGNDEEVNSNNDNNNNNDYTISFVTGAKRLEIVSHGREYDDSDVEPLRETATLDSFFIDIVESYDKDGGTKENDTFALQDPFSYQINIVRATSKRFSSFVKGMQVQGGRIKGRDNTNDDGDTERGGDQQQLSFHIDRPQIEAFGQLSGLLLAPPPTEHSHNDKSDDDRINNGNSMDESESSTGQQSDPDDMSSSEEEYSTFDFSLDGATLDAMGSTIKLTTLSAHYLADGTELSGHVGTFQYFEEPKGRLLSNNNRGVELMMFDLKINVRPSVEMTLGCISTLYIPDVIELKEDMRDVGIALTGETWSLDVDTFYGELPQARDASLTDAEIAQMAAGQLILDGDKEPQKRTLHNKRSSSADDKPSWIIPFPASVAFNHVSIIKGNDEDTKVDVDKAEIMMRPKDDKSGTEIAISIGAMISKLANGADFNCCAVLPAETGTNTFRDFAFSVRVVSVTAGYTVQDWIKTFAPGGMWSPSVRAETTEHVYYKLPFANIAPIELKIQYNALSLVSVKETSITVKQFKGKEHTTVKDVSEFYAKVLLSKMPNFLKNAAILGLDVGDAGAFAIGATLAAANPLAGVAALVGVDAIRGSIEAGKRGRNAKEGDRGNVIDLFSGIGYKAVETTRKGALRRGKASGSRGDVVDWVVGAGGGTGQYIGKNKDKFGQAGGATGGMVVGGVVGGPVGMIVGGLIGGISSGIAMRKADKLIKKEKQEQQKKLEKGAFTLDEA